jgi:hypothetical protein
MESGKLTKNLKSNCETQKQNLTMETKNLTGESERFIVEYFCQVGQNLGFFQKKSYNQTKLRQKILSKIQKTLE